VIRASVALSAANENENENSIGLRHESDPPGPGRQEEHRSVHRHAGRDTPRRARTRIADAERSVSSPSYAASWTKSTPFTVAGGCAAWPPGDPG
jgi:hypothetical protein